MPAFPRFDGHQPLTWVKRVPIYLATLVTALLGLGCIGTALIVTARLDPDPLALSWHGLAAGRVWQPLTHLLLGMPDFFTPFGLFFYYSSAVAIEKFLGRKAFLWLFTWMALIVPLALVLAWRAFGVAVAFAGWYEFMVGTFVAFATLYPNTEAFGFVPLKYLAFAGLVLVLMGFLPSHDWVRVSAVLAQSATGFVFVRFAKGTWSLPSNLPVIRIRRGRARLRVVRAEPDTESAAATSLDALLDKISAQGIDSLTAKERAALAKARATLLGDRDDR